MTRHTYLQGGIKMSAKVLFVVTCLLLLGNEHAMDVESNTTTNNTHVTTSPELPDDVTAISGINSPYPVYFFPSSGTVNNETDDNSNWTHALPTRSVSGRNTTLTSLTVTLTSKTTTPSTTITTSISTTTTTKTTPPTTQTTQPPSYSTTKPTTKSTTKSSTVLTETPTTTMEATTTEQTTTAVTKITTMTQNATENVTSTLLQTTHGADVNSTILSNEINTNETDTIPILEVQTTDNTVQLIDTSKTSGNKTPSMEAPTKETLIEATSLLDNSTADHDNSTTVIEALEDLNNVDKLWPLAVGLTIGLPTLVVFAVTISVLYKRRIGKPRSLLSMYGHEYD